MSLECYSLLIFGYPVTLRRSRTGFLVEVATLPVSHLIAAEYDTALEVARDMVVTYHQAGKREALPVVQVS